MNFRYCYSKTRHQSVAAFTALLIYGFVSVPAHAAAGTAMPWETPLQTILTSITGPVAQIIAVLIIAVSGLTLAFGDTSGGFRRLIQVVFGLSIAFAATTLVTGFFSFTGGALVTGSSA